MNHKFIDIIRERNLAQVNDKNTEPVAIFFDINQKAEENSTATNTGTCLSIVEDETDVAK